MTELWSDHITNAEPIVVQSGSIRYNVIQTVFEDKKKQVALKSSTPEQSWNLKFGPMEDSDIDEIFDFYVARRGRYESFYWLHPYEIATASGAGSYEAGNDETTVPVDKTIRLLGGDTVIINGSPQTTTGTNIKVTGNVAVSTGDTLQARYLVRFGNDLSYETIKSWLYNIGITFERVLT